MSLLRLCPFACTALLCSLVGWGTLNPHARGAEFHHVHLNATDPVAAAKWYADHLGGEAKKLGVFSAVGFGKTVIIFFKAKEGFAGSEGSAVNHIGFSFPELEAKVKQLGDAGVEVVSGVKQAGPIRYAYIKDPWGTLIELVTDPDIEGFHHVHLASTDPEATLAWYTAAFGGDAARFAGQSPGIRYGDMWLLVRKVASAPVATKGRAVDHLGWSFADLDEAAEQLEAQGVTFESRPFNFGTSRIAFIVDPAGVRIELVGPVPKKE